MSRLKNTVWHINSAFLKVFLLALFSSPLLTINLHGKSKTLAASMEVSMFHNFVSCLDVSCTAGSCFGKGSTCFTQGTRTMKASPGQDEKIGVQK